jgi:hypothetical protein
MHKCCADRLQVAPPSGPQQQLLLSTQGLVSVYRKAEAECLSVHWLCPCRR